MSLKISPNTVRFPPSTATMPSSMLHNRRSWMHAAAAKKNIGRAKPSARGVHARHRPAAIANTMLAIEIALGATPACVSLRARACAHARCRVFSGRRGGATSGSIGDALIVLVEVGELCYLSDPGGNSKLVTGITLARPGLAYGFQTQSRSQPGYGNCRGTGRL